MDLNRDIMDMGSSYSQHIVSRLQTMAKIRPYSGMDQYADNSWLDVLLSFLSGRNFDASVRQRPNDKKIGWHGKKLSNSIGTDRKKSY